MRGQHVQALHPVGHPAGRDPVDLGHVAQLGPGGEVGAVRVGVRRGQVGSSASRSSISRIRPDPSSVPISDAARGQVR